MNLDLKRLLFGVAFLTLFSAPPLPAETEKDKNLQKSLSKAENLVLDSKRSEALKELQSLWQKAKAQDRPVLEQKIEELGQIFLTEKGQRAFELGQSLPWEKYKLAENQYDEALAVEDRNLMILKAKAALRIRESGGLKGLEEVEELLKITPWSQDLQALRLQLLLKQGEIEVVEEELKLPASKSPSSTLMEKLRIHRMLEQEKYVKASEALNGLLKKQPQDPELYALKAELQKAQDQNWTASVKRYLELCKKLQPISLKTLTENPLMCLKVEEFEKIIDEIEP